MQINDFIFNVEIEDILAELRSQLALNGFEYLEKTPKRSGNSVQIQCPYHSEGKERRRSAGIRRTDGMFHCFACNEVHSLQEVISFCFGKTEDRAGIWGWKWLLRNFAVVQVEERKDVELDFSRNWGIGSVNTIQGTGRNSISDVGRLGGAGQYVSEEELESYRYYHPYMYKRRLTDDIIDIFDIGYDSHTRCLTFPIRDVEGHTLFIARRSVDSKFFNYPKDVVKPLYGIYELRKTGREKEELIVCESMLDALTAWVYGKTAVALNGLGNELQFEQLRKLPCRKVILATDNDAAGRRARKRLKEKLPYKLVTEYVLPDNKKDLNELEKWEFEALEEVF